MYVPTEKTWFVVNNYLVCVTVVTLLVLQHSEHTCYFFALLQFH
jgi:hypothetical protein